MVSKASVMKTCQVQRPQYRLGFCSHKTLDLAPIGLVIRVIWKAVASSRSVMSEIAGQRESLVLMHLPFSYLALLQDFCVPANNFQAFNISIVCSPPSF